jgi:hypothetical protein
VRVDGSWMRESLHARWRAQSEIHPDHNYSTTGSKLPSSRHCRAWRRNRK